MLLSLTIIQKTIAALSDLSITTQILIAFHSVVLLAWIATAYRESKLILQAETLIQVCTTIVI